MSLPVKLTCPLGHKCEEARDGAIHRCNWFIELRGQNPQTGEAIDERGCAIGWMPILMIETASATRSTGAAIESFRNEMVKANALPRLGEIPLKRLG